ncbi:hypothetical protein VTL71DRAFT_8198, partial [Oculimacula yallundae]
MRAGCCRVVAEKELFSRPRILVEKRCCTYAPEKLRDSASDVPQKNSQYSLKQREIVQLQDQRDQTTSRALEPDIHSPVVTSVANSELPPLFALPQKEQSYGI